MCGFSRFQLKYRQISQSDGCAKAHRCKIVSGRVLSNAYG
jgi:hypothetical protein